ncbi:hypothetical protein BKA69DRAFT_599574 [Paraphysoderma sedebokerense]|nr:hypothetical protein BKA69DRAFT_599574 [Paraphysoderma sedebokerense]
MFVVISFQTPIHSSLLSLLHPLNSYRLAHYDYLAFQCILQNDLPNATKNLEISLKGLEWYHGWSGELGGWMSILRDDSNLDTSYGTKKMERNDESTRIILGRLRVDVPLLKEWIKFLKILGYRCVIYIFIQNIFEFLCSFKILIQEYTLIVFPYKFSTFLLLAIVRGQCVTSTTLCQFVSDLLVVTLSWIQISMILEVWRRCCDCSFRVIWISFVNIRFNYIQILYCKG